jgi:hypothetical protein
MKKLFNLFLLKQKRTKSNLIRPIRGATPAEYKSQGGRIASNKSVAGVLFIFAEQNDRILDSSAGAAS